MHLLYLVRVEQKNMTKENEIYRLEQENNRLREELNQKKFALEAFQQTDRSMASANKSHMSLVCEREAWKSCAEGLAKNIKMAEKGFRNPAYGCEWSDMADDLLECLETFDKLKGEQP